MSNNELLIENTLKEAPRVEILPVPAGVQILASAAISLAFSDKCPASQDLMHIHTGTLLGIVLSGRKADKYDRRWLRDGFCDDPRYLGNDENGYNVYRRSEDDVAVAEVKGATLGGDSVTVILTNNTEKMMDIVGVKRRGRDGTRRTRRHERR